MIIAYRKIKAHRARKAAEAEAATAAAAAGSTTTPETAAAATTTTSTTTDTASSPKKKCPQCAAEKRAARKYRWKLLFCLLPAFFVASLDLTIIATALPEIASHFGQYPPPLCCDISS